MTSKEKNNRTDFKEGALPDVVFSIHKMPRGYKTGRFESDDNIGLLKRTEKSSSLGSKKLGLIIVVLGVVFAFFLSYLIFSYIKNPGFSLQTILSFNKNNNKIEEIQGGVVKDDLADQYEFIVDPLALDFVFIDELEESGAIKEDLDSIEPEVNEDVYLTEGDPLVALIIDSDGDGLSDKEELLLGSDPWSSDSDGDGYDDLGELLNLYNPAGSGRLLENTNIVKYLDEVAGYSFLHPLSWEKNSLSDGSLVILYADDGSFFQVLMEENIYKMDVESWYFSVFPGALFSPEVIMKNNWMGFYGEDGFVFYLVDKNYNNIYTILYNAPDNNSLSYLNIFKAMVESFFID